MSTELNADGRLPCPRCGESIPKVAKVCRFCNHMLEAESLVQAVPQTLSPPQLGSTGQGTAEGAEIKALTASPSGAKGNSKAESIWRYWPLVITGLVLLLASTNRFTQEATTTSSLTDPSRLSPANQELVNTLKVLNGHKAAIAELSNNEVLDLTTVSQDRLDTFIRAMDDVVSGFKGINRKTLEQIHPELVSKFLDPYLQSAIDLRDAAKQRDWVLWHRGEKNLLSAGEWIIKNKEAFKKDGARAEREGTIE